MRIEVKRHRRKNDVYDGVAAIYAAGCIVSQNCRNGETTKWRRKALLRRSVPIRLPIGWIDGRGLDLKSSDWLILHGIEIVGNIEAHRLNRPAGTPIRTSDSPIAVLPRRHPVGSLVGTPPKAPDSQH